MKRVSPLFGALVGIGLMLSGLSIGSCSKETGKPAESPRAAKVPVVGVVNYGEHPILDVIVTAFRARLKERGYTEGQNIKIIWKNVGGDENKAAAATTTLLNSGVDVIMSITTPVSQAVYKQAKGKVPIVFCGVTDPISAGLVSSWQNTPGSGITGTSDRWPYKEQLDLIKQIVPNVKRVGFPYNSGEANSQYALTQVQPLAKERGLEIVPAVATNTSEVRRAVESLASQGVDVIYVSSDNTVMAGFQAVLKVAHERKIPVIVGESANVERGGLATYSVGYPQLGKTTADLVLQVLGGKEPGTIPVATFQGNELYVNLEAAKEMGVTLDPKLVAKAHVVKTTPAGGK